jgi:SAM domain (Sterile alpha motif)
MDIEVWLQQLGMPQYVAAFRENAIDADVLPRLTVDDLKELGFSPSVIGASSLTPLQPWRLSQSL